MEEHEKASNIIRLLKEEYPDAKIALKYSNPLELLIATMLSAQCTDERVNKVTGNLFKKYRSAQDYAEAELEELESDIRPTGFYRNKAKNLKKSCRMIVEEYDSKVPGNMNDLLKLPGVARKTANMVLSNAYVLVEGIAVDTHVKRLAQRLDLTENKTAEKIERDLMKAIPRGEWFPITYLLIDHGRKICTAKRPKCQICVLNEICPSAFSYG